MSSSLHEASQRIAVSDGTAIELLHDLVAIPSTSTNEADAVDFLTGWMAEQGFETGIDAAGNAIGRIGSGSRQIVLLGHIDTVPGQIPVRIEDGVLHGRGSVDAKGPLATFACAALEAARQGANVRITVVGAVGEEHIGSVGARQVATWPAPDFCIIGEPSGWDAICLGYRGSITATYRVRQESRHTAGPGEASAEKVVAFWNALVAEANRRNDGQTGFNALAPAIRDMGTQPRRPDRRGVGPHRLAPAAEGGCSRVAQFHDMLGLRWRVRGPRDPGGRAVDQADSARAALPAGDPGAGRHAALHGQARHI